MADESGNNEFKLGWVLSILYLLFILTISLLFVFASDSKSLSLNNLGDYLAGVFSPLAFLWLVLGYRQQAKELRLQAKELKNTVRELSSQNELNALAQSIHVPRFFPRSIVCSKHTTNNAGQHYVVFEYTLENIGGDAFNLTTSISEEVRQQPSSVQKRTVPKGSIEQCEWSVFYELDEPETHLYVTVSGWDSLDRYFRQDFRTRSKIKLSKEIGVGYTFHMNPYPYKDFIPEPRNL